MSENARKEDFSMEKTAMCEAYFYFACTTGESYDFTVRKEYPADNEDGLLNQLRDYAEAEFNKECKRLFGSKTVSFSGHSGYSCNLVWLDAEGFTATYNGEKVVVEECIPF